MSSPSLTLQCRHCHGIFAAPKTDVSDLVCCPHCATAAPMIEFSAIGGAALEELPVGTPIGWEPAEPDQQNVLGHAKNDANFVVRGKWLQFDCPHCVRPMRLIAEDAGGLVDCAHCGLELIAPDPAIRLRRPSVPSERGQGEPDRPPQPAQPGRYVAPLPGSDRGTRDLWGGGRGSDEGRLDPEPLTGTARDRSPGADASVPSKP